MIRRRSFIAGLAAALAAPAIIRTPGLLMPAKRVIDPNIIAYGNGDGLVYEWERVVLAQPGSGYTHGDIVNLATYPYGIIKPHTVIIIGSTVV